MKRIIYFLIAAALLASCNERQEEIQDYSPDNTSFKSLKVADGFKFISAMSKTLRVELGDGFGLETVAIQLYYANNREEVLAYEGYLTKEKFFERKFLLANHYDKVRIKANVAGANTMVEINKNDINKVILNRADFTEIDTPSGQANQPGQAQDEQSFVYCETDNPNGDVQIVNRVLVIKGSNKEDELDMDRNGSNTKVILKTDGATRVDTEYSNSLFDCIFVYLGEKDDKVQMGSTEKPSLINLGDGKDEITASDQAKDIIYGGDGKDKIIGKYATDELIGGNGSDDIDNSSGGNITADGAEENCTPICGSVDADGDGVDETADVDDNDPLVSQYNYPQGYDEGSSTYVFHSLVYEDLWPCQGDYDFNDMVVYYSIRENQNAISVTTSFNVNMKFPAMGGRYDNTACIRVVDPSNESEFGSSNLDSLLGSISVTRTHDAVNGTTSYCFSNLKSLYGEGPGNIVNTETKTYTDYPTITGKISGFTSGIDVYDQYMLIKGDATQQVHDIANDNPNAALNSATSSAVGFDSCDDASTAQGTQFTTANGLPWALSIPDEWKWPKEKVDMLEAYPDFDDFIANPELDWYSDANTNKDSSKIIN